MRTRIPAAAGLAAAALLAAGCWSPRAAAPPPDRDLAAAMNAGRRYFQREQYEAAARCYRATLERARRLDAPRELADSAYNLAAALAARGRTAEARPYLREARAELDALDQTGAAEATLLEARIAQAEGRAAEAAALAAETLERLGAGGPPELRAQAHALRAALAAAAGDAAAARDAAALAQAAAAGLPAASPVRAQALAAEAAAAKVEGRAEAAAALYDQAAEGFGRAGRHAERARAVLRAAAAWEAAGRWDAAGARYYRGARSLTAQGDFTNALPAAEGALRMAEKTADQGLRERTAWLLETLREALARERQRQGEAAGPAAE